MSEYNLFSYLRSMMMMLAVVSVVICLVLTPTYGQLDELNCLKLSSLQFTHTRDTIKVTSYDVSLLLSSLLDLYIELEKFDLKPFGYQDDWISAPSLYSALLFGNPISWGQMSDEAINHLAPNEHIVLDILKVATSQKAGNDTLFADHQDGLCLFSGIETELGICEASLDLSASNLSLSMPSGESPLNKILMLQASRTAFNWESPTAKSDGRYVIRATDTGLQVFNLRELIGEQFDRMLSKLVPFVQFVEDSGPCNYFLKEALCLSHTGLHCNQLTAVKRGELLSLCPDILNFIFPLKTRSERGLLNWLFTDQTESISRLIKAQHYSVRADKILVQNDLILSDNLDVLRRNMLSLKETERENSEHLLRLILQTQVRGTLHQVNSNLKAHKVDTLGLLRDLNNRMSIIELEFNRCMARLVSDLSETPSCSMLYTGDSGSMACVSKQAYIQSIRQGVIRVSAPAVQHNLREVYVISCLYLASDKYYYKALYKGNRRAFLMSDSFYHSENISCPRDCFQHPDSETWKCDECLSGPSDEVIPPLYHHPFFFIVDEKNRVYLQSVSGPQSVIIKGKTEIIGEVPVLVRKNNFPIEYENRLIAFSDIVKSSNESVVGNYWLGWHKPEDFRFSVSDLGARSLKLSQWRSVLEETSDLFQQSKVFQAMSITACLFAAGVIFVFIFCVIRCCKNRDQNQVAVLYQRVRRSRHRQQNEIPSLGAKPEPGSVKSVNRNHSLNPVINALRRNNKKLKNSSEDEEIQLNPM